MNIYIFLCQLFFFSALLEPILPKLQRRILFLINGVILLVIVGTRACGTDYYLYQSSIQGNIDENWTDFLVYISKKLNFNLLIFVEAMLTIIPFYLIFWKFSDKHLNLLSLFFFVEFFFFTLMQQARQGVAIGLVMLGLFFLESRKTQAVSYTTAFLFHQTAIGGIICHFFPKHFLKVIVYIIIYGACLLFSMFFFDILLKYVSAFDIAYIVYKVDGYIDRAYRYDQTNPYFSFKLLTYLFVIIASFYFKHFRNRVPYYCNVLIFSICFYTLFVPLPELSTRLPRYFVISWFLLSVALIENPYVSKTFRKIFYAFILIYLGYLTIRVYNMVVDQQQYLQLIPYKSILF